MKWIKDNLLLLIVIAALSLLGLKQCRDVRIAQKKLEVAEHNISALNDTIRLTKTKDNKPEFDKLAFLTNEVSELKKLSQDLYAEVKNTKGKVSTIIKGGIQLVHDTTYLPAETTVEEGLITTSFKHDTAYSPGNSRSIAGVTTYNLDTKASSAKITKDSINMSFVTGIRGLDKGKPEIFLRSDFPGFSATNIQGAVLDNKLFQPKNKQHLLTVGIQVGYVPITYSLSNKKVSFDATRFGVGAGVNINLLRLFGK